MREFASPNAAAASLSRPAKLLYTGFCAFTAAGLATCVGLYDGVVRFGVHTTPAQLYAHLVGYYRPEAASGPARAPQVAGVSPHRLLEITHSHLFSMPLYLLVLGHLFLLSRLSARAKRGWISAGVAATAAHLFAPWGVYLGGAALAWLYPISGAALFVTFAVLMGAPLLDMWWPRGGDDARGRKIVQSGSKFENRSQN
jgi:hypothetical protein